MANLAPVKHKDVFESLRDDIEHAFQRWTPARFFEGRELALPAIWNNGAPALDVDEDENEVHVRAELPGVNKEDLKVEVEGDRLTIRGEKKTSKEEKEKDYLYKECSYGAFTRAVTLPCEVKADKIQANLKDGVLDLRLPKDESAKPKRVQVKVGG